MTDRTDPPRVLEYRTPPVPKLTGWGTVRGVVWTCVIGLIIGGPLVMFAVGGVFLGIGGALDSSLPVVQRAGVAVIAGGFSVACGVGLHALVNDLARAWREGLW